MEYRILPGGQQIPVSNRYRAHQMFIQGCSRDEVVASLKINRALAGQYQYEVKAQQRAKGESIDHVAVGIPARLAPAVRKALIDYLTDACVPVFLAAQVKSIP